MSVTEQAEAALPSIIILVLTPVLRWRCDGAAMLGAEKGAWG